MNIMGTTVPDKVLLLDRPYEPISLTPLIHNAAKRELRIHGESPKGDRTTILSAHEMRLLAYRLLAEAEQINAG